jgi:mercuric ion transport protein
MHVVAMTINDQGRGERSRHTPALLAAGGLLGALAASSCCILPLVLFGFGVSGAWIGNFTRLAAYQPLFLATALVCIGVGALLVRRTSANACADGAACARPLPRRWVTAALIAAALLVVAAIGFDLLGPLLLS